MRTANPLTAAERAKLRDFVLAGGAPKEFDARGSSWACRQLNYLGIRKRFVTAEEWQHIRDRRSRQRRKAAA